VEIRTTRDICRALSTVKNKIKPTLKANYLLWPAAHLVNFGLVPLDLRCALNGKCLFPLHMRDRVSPLC